MATSFHNLTRVFMQRLGLVPPAERDSATAHFDAAVRKAGGGIRRILHTTGNGTEPLPNFFRAARLAWRDLPKESDDQKKTAPVELCGLPFKCSTKGDNL
jgi:hypothetical protein